MSPHTTVLEVGARVAESYEVVRLIGRGGMGEVWLAKHLRLPGKQVAIKVLHTKGSHLSADALGRFKREAEVATRIGHPNIVDVHDYNTLPNGSPYLVLEFLQGESLASRLRFGAIGLDEVTLLIRQVGSALDAVHAAGVVHRDLKPDNIFLVPTPSGTQVKVLDFGISKVVDSTTLQTADEVLVGTPQYMSPEQATGHNRDVGPQTDVFALGSIAYEMLSGAPPFSADSVAKVVFRIAYEPHVPLEQVKPGLPERVYQAVNRALEKDRTKRYETIADFITGFSGQPVPRTLPPPSGAGEFSGVARPGMATPDSLAWGATAAPTPAPSRPPSTAPVTGLPAGPVPPAPTAPARRLWMLMVAGVSVAVVSGSLVFMLQQGDGRGVPQTQLSSQRAPTQQQPQPQPLPEPKAVQPDVLPAARPVEPPPATDPVPKVVPAAASSAKKIPPEDAEVIGQLEEYVRTLKEPLNRTRQGLMTLKTEVGLSRGYALCAIAACKEQLLASAKPMFEKVTEKADRARVLHECRKLGVALE